MFLLRPSLRPQLHALGWLAGLLLSQLSSAAVRHDCSTMAF